MLQMSFPNMLHMHHKKCRKCHVYPFEFQNMNSGFLLISVCALCDMRQLCKFSIHINHANQSEEGKNSRSKLCCFHTFSKKSFVFCAFVFFISGIFAYLNYLTPKTRREILELLVTGLKRLEYRGYDSAGVAIDSNDGHNMLLVKRSGKVLVLEEAIKQGIPINSLPFACTFFSLNATYL